MMKAKIKTERHSVRIFAELSKWMNQGPSKYFTFLINVEKYSVCVCVCVCVCLTCILCDRSRPLLYWAKAFFKFIAGFFNMEFFFLTPLLLYVLFHRHPPIRHTTTKFYYFKEIDLAPPSGGPGSSDRSGYFNQLVDYHEDTIRKTENISKGHHPRSPGPMSSLTCTITKLFQL